MRVSVPTAGAVALVVSIVVVALWTSRHDESPVPVPMNGVTPPAAHQFPHNRPRRARATEPTADDDVAIPDAPVGESPGDPKPTESKVVTEPGWILRHQDESGAWHDPATTGMVLLSFLGAGETHQSGSKRDIVKRALEALIAGQDAYGCLVPGTCGRQLCGHAIAGLALTEAYGMTGARSLKDPAQRAVTFALASRRRGAAWDEDDVQLLDPPLDLETTAWMSLLLKSAAMSELDVDRAVFPEILGALDRVTDPATGRVQPWGVLDPLTEDAATAIGFALRVLLDSKQDERRKVTAADWLAERPLAAKAADWLLAHPPAPDTGDLEYVYFGSVGMIALGGAPFRAWLPALNAVVARPAVADGPDKGSWDPSSGGGEVDRIWATAFHLRFLELYYGPVGHASMRK